MSTTSKVTLVTIAAMILLAQQGEATKFSIPWKRPQPINTDLVFKAYDEEEGIWGEAGKFVAKEIAKELSSEAVKGGIKWVKQHVHEEEEEEGLWGEAGKFVAKEIAKELSSEAVKGGIKWVKQHVHEEEGDATSLPYRSYHPFMVAYQEALMEEFGVDDLQGIPPALIEIGGKILVNVGTDLITGLIKDLNRPPAKKVGKKVTRHEEEEEDLVFITPPNFTTKPIRVIAYDEEEFVAPSGPWKPRGPIFYDEEEFVAPTGGFKPWKPILYDEEEFVAPEFIKIKPHQWKPQPIFQDEEFTAPVPISTRPWNPVLYDEEESVNKAEILKALKDDKKSFKKHQQRKYRTQRD